MTAHSLAFRTPPPAPTPRDRPLGMAGLLYALMTDPLRVWTKAHYREPVMFIESVLGPSCVVSDPDGIRHVLLDNAANYRRDALARRILSPGLGTGLLTVEGQAWRTQRRILAPLFNARTTESFAPAMAAAAGALADRWARRRDGQPMDVAPEMTRVTLDVLQRTIFTSGLATGPDELASAINAYFNSFGRVDPMDVLGAPDWIPRITRLRGGTSLGFFDRMVTELIASRRALLASGEPQTAPRDLLTLLLEASDPETGQGLSEDDVRANVVTFIGAGHETTANALTWTLFLLGAHPEVRAGVEAEIDREWDGSPASVERLPLLRAALDESLRLYPPVPSITREAIEADTVCGREIPAGTRIVVSPWIVHRHRTLWSEPDYFRPERFLGEARAAIPRFAYLPFGVGPRICIGAAFALQEAMIVLATVLSRFRLELVPGQDVMPRQRVTLRPANGLRMTIHRRERSPGL